MKWEVKAISPHLEGDVSRADSSMSACMYMGTSKVQKYIHHFGKDVQVSARIVTLKRRADFRNVHT